jgi:hypothetical protein
MRAWLGILIWMGYQKLKRVEEYWNTQEDRGAIFPNIRSAMSLKRWEQIHGFSYVCELNAGVYFQDQGCRSGVYKYLPVFDHANLNLKRGGQIPPT